VAVLIGGANASYRMPPECLQHIAASLAALARQGAGLMVTTSRRTGVEGEAILHRALAGLPAALWDGTGENPYLGYLALADHVLATADSISMVTEASMTGRPLHILELPGGSAKFHEFHRSMRDAGITRPFAGVLDSWSYPIRNDTELAGRCIRQMLSPNGSITADM
jgi:mitochondrial fission protein ELM1